MDEDFFEMSLTTGSFNATEKCKINKEFTYRYLSTVYLVVFLIGLFSNGFGLFNLCMNWKKWSSLNVFVLNLGIADLLYVITLPFFVAYYMNKEVWMFGNGFCQLTRSLFHINMYASISFLTCISVQRYLGIVHPMKMMGKFQNLRHSFYISILVWIWVLIQVLPNLMFMNNNKNVTHCHDSTTNENLDRYTIYTMIITLTGFCIPFIIIVVCYSRVLTVLKRNKNVDSNLKRRSIKLVFIVLILFSVCFLPFYVFRNLNLLSRIWQLQGTCTQTLKHLYISYQVTRGLASMNSAINPLLYIVTNENFVLRFRSIQNRAWQTIVYMGKSPSLTDTKRLNVIVRREQEQVSEDL
ncbi:P2Y purinoceptor 1-like [Discoglossus pictus]